MNANSNNRIETGRYISDRFHPTSTNQSQTSPAAVIDRNWLPCLLPPRATFPRIPRLRESGWRNGTQIQSRYVKFASRPRLPPPVPVSRRRRRWGWRGPRRLRTARRLRCCLRRRGNGAQEAWAEGPRPRRRWGTWLSPSWAPVCSASPTPSARPAGSRAPSASPPPAPPRSTACCYSSVRSPARPSLLTDPHTACCSRAGVGEYSRRRSRSLSSPPFVLLFDRAWRALRQLCAAACSVRCAVPFQIRSSEWLIKLKIF
jgi:hypothetical protein